MAGGGGGASWRGGPPAKGGPPPGGPTPLNGGRKPGGRQPGPGVKAGGWCGGRGGGGGRGAAAPGAGEGGGADIVCVCGVGAAPAEGSAVSGVVPPREGLGRREWVGREKKRRRRLALTTLFSSACPGTCRALCILPLAPTSRVIAHCPRIGRRRAPGAAASPLAPRARSRPPRSPARRLPVCAALRTLPSALPTHAYAPHSWLQLGGAASGACGRGGPRPDARSTLAIGRRRRRAPRPPLPPPSCPLPPHHARGHALCVA